jgi:hypothetical protein
MAAALIIDVSGPGVESLGRVWGAVTIFDSQKIQSAVLQMAPPFARGHMQTSLRL